VLFGPRSNGAYAQYVSVPAAFVCPKPDSLSFQQAACLGVAGMTAYDAVVNKGRIQRGEKVFVAGGAGGVGSFAIPLIRYCGVTSIIATTGGDESADHLINSLSIDSKNLIYYQKQSLEEMDARVRELTNGKGVAVAFDFVGGDMKRLCFNAAGFDGRVVSTVEEPPEFDFNIWRADISPLFAKSNIWRADISPLFAKAGTYHFVALSARARSGGPDDWGVYRDMMAGLARLAEAGHLTLPKATDLGELTEENIRKAHTMLEAGHVKGKLVLSVG
jgi:NADPH2:quinone reductase